ncbi:hypothetical protein H0H93_013227, partial [Arthromyces matolae]
VLRRSKVVLDGLISVAKSGRKEALARMETNLKSYHALLDSVFVLLQASKSKGLLSRTLNRKAMLSDVEKYNRLLDDYNMEFLTDFLLQSGITGPPPQLPPTSLIVADPPVLPKKPELMMGRDEEKSKIVDTLLHKSPARIAILGAGGIGKTTLALSVLHDPEIADCYPSRYFVSCETTLDVVSVIGGIADALRIPQENRDEHLLETILSSFPNDALLCLDNLETIWNDKTMCAEVERLLLDLEIPKLGLMVTMQGTQRPSKVAWSRPFLSPLQGLDVVTGISIFEQMCSRPPDEYEKRLLDATGGIPTTILLVCDMLEEGNEISKSLWSWWEEAQSRVVEIDEHDGHPTLGGEEMVQHARQLRGKPQNLVGQAYNLEKLGTALQLRIQEQNLHGEAWNCRNLGDTWVRQKKLEKAEEMFQRSLQLYVQIQNLSGEVDNCSRLGDIWLEQKKLEKAEEMFKRVLQLCIKTQNLRVEAWNCQKLGNVWLQQTKLEQAEEMFQRALELCIQTDNVAHQGWNCERLGEIWLQRNKLEEAEEMFQRALQLRIQIRDLSGEANICARLGGIWLQEKKLEKAEEMFQRSVQLYMQTRYRPGEAYAWSCEKLGEIWLQQNKLGKAEEMFQRALQLRMQK